MGWVLSIYQSTFPVPTSSSIPTTYSKTSWLLSFSWTGTPKTLKLTCLLLFEHFHIVMNPQIHLLQRCYLLLKHIPVRIHHCIYFFLYFFSSNIVLKFSISTAHTSRTTNLMISDWDSNCWSMFFFSLSRFCFILRVIIARKHH